jgi:outer membrane protein TolC
LIKEQNIQSLKGMLAQTFNQYLMNKELERIEQKNIEVAQKNLDISMEKMRIGTITGFEIREAQKNVIDAEFRYIDTQYMSKIAEVELLRISGQLKLNN